MQDPLLARVHLIAEPWDAGVGGYQVGHFPDRFAEWNDKYRDAMRGYWLRTGVSRGEFARRFTASSDIFHHGQRLPTASVNFLSVHDGFTLLDTLSYRKKHNQANGEHNQDGRDNELCDNFGAEGKTDNTAIKTIRQRVRRSMMATLLLSQGTPMICAGDEIGKTQAGNNNAYCQDNATSWLDWENADIAFKDFVAKVLALRRNEPMLRHDQWFSHHAKNATDPQIHWLRADGHAMQIHDWHDDSQHALCFHLIVPQGPENLLARQGWMALNPGSEALEFILPAGHWQVLLDTSECLSSEVVLADRLILPGHSLLVLRLVIAS